jgi:hypothetical protein
MKTLPASPSPVLVTLNSRLTTLKEWSIRHDRLTVLLVFTMLSLAITWPVVLHLNEWIIGPVPEGDPLYQTWTLWWYKQALETGQDPFHTHNIFALLPSAQVFVHSYFDSIVGVPLQWLFSPLGAYNLLIELSILLSGFTMYLLAGEFTRNKLACFVAGFLYTFSTYHLVRMGGFLNLSTLQFIPFCAWRVFVFYRRPGCRSAILAGLGIGLIPLSEIYFLAYFGLPFGALFLLGKLITDFKWFLKPRNLGLAALALGIAALITVPLLLPFLRIDPDVQEEARRVAGITTEQLSANLAAYFLPHFSNPFFGGLTGPIYNTFEYQGEKTVYLGYITLGLVVTALFSRKHRNRATYFWLVLSLVSIGLSFGPKLYILENPVINWPFYNLVYDYPLFSTFRAPVRMGFLSIMSLAVMASLALESLYSKYALNRRAKFIFYGCVTALLLASLAEHLAWSFPLPSQAVPIPAIYSRIAADPENGLVLDLPDRQPSPGSYMFYQTIHHKLIVGGYPPRTSDRMITSMENLPYLVPFIYPQLAGNPAAYGQDIYPYNIDFKAALQEKKITYVILHQHEAFNPADFEVMLGFLRAQLGVPVYDSPAEKVIAWHVASNPAPAQPSASYRFSRGTGWLTHRINFDNSSLERIVSQDGQLLVQAPAAGSQVLQLVARPYFKPLSLELRLNGQVVDTVRLNSPGKVQTVTFKPLTLNQGRNIIEMHSVEGCQPRYLYVPESRDPDCYSFGIQQIRLVE